MLKQIKQLLALLNNKSVDYQLDKDTWEHAISLYLSSSQTEQDQLVDGLAQRFLLNTDMLNNAFADCSAKEANHQTIEGCLATLHSEQLKAENLKITKVKTRSFRLVPLLSQLAIERNEWLELIRKHEKQGMKSLSKPFILAAFSSIKKIEYELLVNQLSKENYPREAKVSNNQVPQQLNRRLKKRKYQDEGNNPFIFPLSAENSHLHSPLGKTGVRIASLAPATPERGYQALQKTPMVALSRD